MNKEKNMQIQKLEEEMTDMEIQQLMKEMTEEEIIECCVNSIRSTLGVKK